MFSIIVLETLIGLGFFCLLGGGLFSEFDLFWDLLLFCLVGYFYMEDFLLYLKQACHWLQIKNCLCCAGSAPEGLWCGAAVSTHVQCFCRDSKQYIVALLCQTAQTFWALTQKAWLRVLPASSQQPRRSLLETHIGPRGVCSLHICGQCCCVLVVKAAPSDGETGQQSARFWVWVGGFQGGVWDGISCSLGVSACSFLVVKWRLSVPA